MNAKAARLVASIAHLGEGDVMVEIGCVRAPNEIPSDGYSTVYLAQAAKVQGFTFHSVDIDPNAVQIARHLTAGLPAQVHLGDGAEWLQEQADLPQIRSIDALFIDGAASPEEALSQYDAALLDPEAVVIVDDIQAIDTYVQGKGTELLTALERDGFEVQIYATEPGYLMAVAT